MQIAMTRKDYIRYIRTRKELTATIKSMVLVGYWRIRKTNWVKTSGFCGILLGLQTLTNAMLLKSTILTVVSVIMILIGMKISK